MPRKRVSQAVSDQHRLEKEHILLPEERTDFERARGVITDVRRIEVASSPGVIFKIISGMGGMRGWYFANWAWRLRGFADRLMGGVGMRRKRRDPDFVSTGETIDFWHVEQVVPHQKMLLRAEIKLPGRAWLQFDCVPLNGDGTRSLYTQTALFEPKGIGGLLYWYLSYPIHWLIFWGLSRKIARKSEEIFGALVKVQAAVDPIKPAW